MTNSGRTPSSVTEIGTALAVAAAYFTIAATTVAFTRFQGGVALVWIANAVLIVHLSHRPAHAWPAPVAACALASLLATSWFGVGPAAAPGLALVNVAEAVIVIGLLRCFGLKRGFFDDLQSVLLFTLAAAAAAAITAPLGAGLVIWATGTPFLANLSNWAVGHALGTMVLTPLVALLYGGEVQRWAAASDDRKRVEGAVVLGVVALVTFATFYQRTLPLLFMPALPLIVAAFRLGRLGAACSIFILVAISAVLTLGGRGPMMLVAGDSAFRAQFYQFYLAVTVMTVLPAAAYLRERKTLLNKLQESEARLRALMENSSDALFSLGASGNIKFVSPAAGVLFGCAPEALVGRNAAELVIVEDRPRVQKIMRDTFEQPGRAFIAEYRAILADGSIAWHESHNRAVCNLDGQPVAFVSSIRDVTSRKVRENRLTQAASTDALTGLANRRAFDGGVQIALNDVAQGSAACLAILDLDHFKAINDRHGHGAGDAVLRRIGEIGRAELRAGDLMARIGGEEFALLLRHVDLAAATSICERIRTRIGDALIDVGGGRAITVTASIGIAQVTTPGDAVTLLRRADDALYRAKAAGRNRLMQAA